MIPAGYKIVVLSSSATKSGANIRRGSTGYVSSTLKPVLVDKLGAQISVAEVVFTRFGFQNKERLEKKKINILLPHKIEASGPNPQRLLNRMTKRALDFSSSTRGAKSPSVVVWPQASDIFKTENEFSGWFYAMMASRPFKRVIDGPSNVMTNRLYKQIGKAGELRVKDAQKSRTIALNLASSIFKDPSSWAPLLTALSAKRQLNSMKFRTDKIRQLCGTFGSMYLFRSRTLWECGYRGITLDSPKAEKILKRNSDVQDWIDVLTKMCDTIY